MGWTGGWRWRLALVLLVSAGVAAAQQGQSAGDAQAWVSPRYQTTPPQQRELTLVQHYHYTERRYEPPVTIHEPLEEARFGSPEEAMITRISAMMRGDYEAWLAAWDPASREFVAGRNAAEGQSPEDWTTLWADRLRLMRFQLVRRIETGPYVMVTYTMVTPEGEPATVLELPTVFRRFDGRWLATQELARDPLAPASPWVSGRYTQEVVVE